MLDKTLVQQFFERGYNSQEIAAAIGLNFNIWKSVRTVQRHLREAGLQRKGEESSLDDIGNAVAAELDDTGRLLGIKQIWQRIRRKHGVLCRRQTVRDIIDIYQPTRLDTLRKGRLQRRQYLVHGPNQIWHIDGNDKLMPFGFGISAAIDGWSHKLLWLKIDKTNKDPKLICSYFLETVQDLGLVPCVVRMDRGTENVNIADVQTLLRAGHNDPFSTIPVMFGSSNHNTRIERWWGYGRNAIFQTYIDMFKDLVMSGVLQIDNILHIECLRFCFMPALRKELENHFEHWNNYHRVRKMKNSLVPSGIPDFLYKYPEYYGAVDQKQPVNQNVVENCIAIQSCSQSDFGCSDEFAEWALNMMVDRDSAIPRSMFDAYNLFTDLLLKIYEFDTNDE